MIRIEIAPTLRVEINGQVVHTALTVSELHGLLGPPSRIESGRPPAPVGFRNNQIHIYDQDGVYFYEHHHTRRISGCKLVRRYEKSEPFEPRHLYHQPIMIAGVSLSDGDDIAEFLTRCPIRLERSPIGWLRATQDGFSVIVTSQNISLSWPHDPWAEPSQ